MKLSSLQEISSPKGELELEIVQEDEEQATGTGKSPKLQIELHDRFPPPRNLSLSIWGAEPTSLSFTSNELKEVIQ